MNITDTLRARVKQIETSSAIKLNEHLSKTPLPLTAYGPKVTGNTRLLRELIYEGSFLGRDGDLLAQFPGLKGALVMSAATSPANTDPELVRVALKGLLDETAHLLRLQSNKAAAPDDVASLLKGMLDNNDAPSQVKETPDIYTLFESASLSGESLHGFFQNIKPVITDPEFQASLLATSNPTHNADKNQNEICDLIKDIVDLHLSDKTLAHDRNSRSSFIPLLQAMELLPNTPISDDRLLNELQNIQVIVDPNSKELERINAIETQTANTKQINRQSATDSLTNFLRQEMSDMPAYHTELLDAYTTGPTHDKIWPSLLSSARMDRLDLFDDVINNQDLPKHVRSDITNYRDIAASGEFWGVLEAVAKGHLAGGEVAAKEIEKMFAATMTKASFWNKGFTFTPDQKWNPLNLAGAAGEGDPEALHELFDNVFEGALRQTLSPARQYNSLQHLLVDHISGYPDLTIEEQYSMMSGIYGMSDTDAFHIVVDINDLSSEEAAKLASQQPSLKRYMDTILSRDLDSILSSDLEWTPLEEYPKYLATAQRLISGFGLDSIDKEISRLAGGQENAVELGEWLLDTIKQGVKEHIQNDPDIDFPSLESMISASIYGKTREDIVNVAIKAAEDQGNDIAMRGILGMYLATGTLGLDKAVEKGLITEQGLQKFNAKRRAQFLDNYASAPNLSDSPSGFYKNLYQTALDLGDQDYSVDQIIDHHTHITDYSNREAANSKRVEVRRNAQLALQERADRFLRSALDDIMGAKNYTERMEIACRLAIETKEFFTDLEHWNNTYLKPRVEALEYAVDGYYFAQEALQSVGADPSGNPLSLMQRASEAVKSIGLPEHYYATSAIDRISNGYEDLHKLPVLLTVADDLTDKISPLSIQTPGDLVLAEELLESGVEVDWNQAALIHTPGLALLQQLAIKLDHKLPPDLPIIDPLEAITNPASDFPYIESNTHLIEPAIELSGELHNPEKATSFVENLIIDAKRYIQHLNEISADDFKGGSDNDKQQVIVSGLAQLNQALTVPILAEVADFAGCNVEDQLHSCQMEAFKMAVANGIADYPAPAVIGIGDREKSILERRKEFPSLAEDFEGVLVESVLNELKLDRATSVHPHPMASLNDLERFYKREGFSPDSSFMVALDAVKAAVNESLASGKPAAVSYSGLDSADLIQSLIKLRSHHDINPGSTAPDLKQDAEYYDHLVWLAKTAQRREFPRVKSLAEGLWEELTDKIAFSESPTAAQLYTPSNQLITDGMYFQSDNLYEDELLTPRYEIVPVETIRGDQRKAIQSALAAQTNRAQIDLTIAGMPLSFSPRNMHCLDGLMPLQEKSQAFQPMPDDMVFDQSLESSAIIASYPENWTLADAVRNSSNSARSLKSINSERITKDQTLRVTRPTDLAAPCLPIDGKPSLFNSDQYQRLFVAHSGGLSVPASAALKKQGMQDATGPDGALKTIEQMKSDLEQELEKKAKQGLKTKNPASMAFG